jgi:hypothetical protein
MRTHTAQHVSSSLLRTRPVPDDNAEAQNVRRSLIAGAPGFIGLPEIHEARSGVRVALWAESDKATTLRSVVYSKALNKLGAPLLGKSSNVAVSASLGETRYLGVCF